VAPALLSAFITVVLFEQFHAGLLKGWANHSAHNTDNSFTCEQLSLPHRLPILHHKLTKF